MESSQGYGDSGLSSNNTGSNNKKRPKFNRWSLFGIVLISAASTILYVYNVIQIDGLLREIRELDKLKKELNAELEGARVEVTELESADRIIAIAKDKLSMVQSDTVPQLIEFKSGKE